MTSFATDQFFLAIAIPQKTTTNWWACHARNLAVATRSSRCEVFQSCNAVSLFLIYVLRYGLAGSHTGLSGKDQLAFESFALFVYQSAPWNIHGSHS